MADPPGVVDLGRKNPWPESTSRGLEAGRRRSLDSEISMIPMIDLPMVTISVGV
jgi:hypothetical protein